MQKQTLQKVYQRQLILERIHLRAFYNNIKMIIRLKTPITKEDLEKAVQKISKTHPLLVSRVKIDQEGKATFTTENAPELPLKVYKKHSSEDYKEILYQEDLDLINTEKGPLGRIILLEHPEVPEIIIYVNHIACDGLSLLHVSKHLLQYLADPDKEAEVITPIEYTEELIRRYPLGLVEKFMINRVNKDWSKRRRIFTEQEHQALQKECPRDKLVEIKLTEEETTALRNRCREENVTVNSYLVTTMLSASRATPELKRSDEVAFAVNIRGMLEADPGEACGLYASGVTFNMKYSDSSSFWDNVCTAHNIGREKLNDPDALFNRRTSSIMLDPTIYDALIFATFTDYKDKLIDRFNDKIAKPDLGGILTNLGGVTIPREYGKIQVDDMVFIPPGSAGGILAVGVSSIMIKLNLVIPYREPVFSEEVALRFKARFEEILHETIYQDAFIS